MTTEPIWKVQLTEAQFQEQIVTYAELCGWKWLHIEKTGNERGYWRTPTKGPLAKFPDLMLVRGNRLVFAELKAEKGRISPDQQLVLMILQSVGECYIWRPSQWEEIMGRLA